MKSQKGEYICPSPPPPPQLPKKCYILKLTLFLAYLKYCVIIRVNGLTELHQQAAQENLLIPLHSASPNEMLMMNSDWIQ